MWIKLKHLLSLEIKKRSLSQFGFVNLLLRKFIYIYKFIELSTKYKRISFLKIPGKKIRLILIVIFTSRTSSTFNVDYPEDEGHMTRVMHGICKYRVDDDLLY